MDKLTDKEWLEIDLRLALRAAQVEPGLPIKTVARIVREVFPYDYLTLLTKELLAYEDNKEAGGEAESAAESVEGQCSPESDRVEPSGS